MRRLLKILKISKIPKIKVPKLTRPRLPKRPRLRVPKLQKPRIPKLRLSDIRARIRMPRKSDFKFSRRKKEYPYGVRPLPFYERFPLFNLPVIKFIVLLLAMIIWIVIDIVRAIIRKRSRKVHLYGIWCFVGLPGAGKTMSLVHYLDEQRRLYSDKIIIITNFYYKGEDAHLTGWDMLLHEYDKPVIFAWDELQNEFNSREYRKFPMRLVHELTQNRKGNGKQVVYTTQTFTAVDNNFRNLTIRVVDCKTHFGRMTTCRHYKREFYEARMESKSIERKVKIKPIRKQTFIQTDYLRSRYDSFQRLDYLKGLNYVGLASDVTRK